MEIHPAGEAWRRCLKRGLGSWLDEGAKRAFKSVDLHRSPFGMDPEPGSSAARTANCFRHQQVDL